MIRTRLELGHDAEVGAEETRAKLGNQLFARTLAAILRVAAEIAIGTMRRRRPMDVMPISA